MLRAPSPGGGGAEPAAQRGGGRRARAGGGGGGGRGPGAVAARARPRLRSLLAPAPPLPAGALGTACKPAPAPPLSAGADPPRSAPAPPLPSRSEACGAGRGIGGAGWAEWVGGGDPAEPAAANPPRRASSPALARPASAAARPPGRPSSRRLRPGDLVGVAGGDLGRRQPVDGHQVDVPRSPGPSPGAGKMGVWTPEAETGAAQPAHPPEGTLTSFPWSLRRGPRWAENYGNAVRVCIPRIWSENLMAGIENCPRESRSTCRPPAP
ncbi:uncharacterized protein LOC114672692 [Macaca mulatta]